MKINHNIQALNAYRNLSQTMNQTSKTLEKLSSGMRINRAADDAAGLAISEKMRSQIRGLDMAERNTLDAISLIQTGEGALNQTHEILQRMRELSVQAANGTLEEQDRNAIQTEIDQLTFEIDRIADTTQFNQKKLFSGSEKGKAFVESNKIEYDGGNSFSGLITASPTDPAEVTFDFDKSFGELSKADLDTKTFDINGVTYEIDIDGDGSEGISNGNIAIVLDSADWTDNTTDDGTAAVNVNNFLTSFKSAIETNQTDFTVQQTQAQDSDVDGTNNNMINGQLTMTSVANMSPKEAEAIKIDFSGAPTSGIKVLDPTDPTATNTVTNFVGKNEADDAEPVSLTFSNLPKEGDELYIDGLLFEFKSGSSADYIYDGDNANVTINLDNKDIFTVLGEIDSALGEAKLDNHVEALDSHEVVGNTLVLATKKTDDGKSFVDSSNGLEIGILDNDYEANKGKDLQLEMQIGANASEVLELSLGVMDAATLGLARANDGSYLSTGINAKKGIDVSSTEAARVAITRFDEAIRMVSEERSKLGAMQNRLEHTTTNLQTANENLTAAESRIRDTDMAKSMTEFTKNNILNQAGQAMLAQANQLPQGVLQLLK
jgi:flagellin